MIEIAGVIMPHVDLLHHTSRSHVAGNRIGDHFLELQGLKRIVKHCLRSFGCQSSIPVSASQSPANFNGRGKSCLEGHMLNSHKANESGVSDYFRGKKTESILLLMCLNSGDHVVTFLT